MNECDEIKQIPIGPRKPTEPVTKVEVSPTPEEPLPFWAEFLVLVIGTPLVLIGAVIEKTLEALSGSDSNRR